MANRMAGSAPRWLGGYRVIVTPVGAWWPVAIFTPSADAPPAAEPPERPGPRYAAGAVSSEERRRYPRFDVPSAPGLLDGQHPFETLKLSAGGMLIRLPVELTLDQRVRVEMRLGGHLFRSEARVVFFGPDLSSAATGEAYRVGLAFVEVSPADQALLDRFIAQELAGTPR